jgi:hypothetical protein
VGNLYANITNDLISGTTNALCAVPASNSRIANCNGAPTDLAEYYGTDDLSIEAGDLVVFASEAYVTMVNGVQTSKAWIKKASTAYEPALLGVISTSPNQVYGEGVFTSEENPHPVTLVGRTQVKVNLQNGPIKTGDRITASGTTGIGMKATRPGITIGIALESLSSESFDKIATGSAQYAKIIVLVDPGYWVPSSTETAGQTASTSIEFIYSGMTIGSLFDAIVAKFADMYQIVFEQGLLRVANIISDKLTTDELCIGTTCVTEDQLRALLDASGVPQQTSSEEEQTTPSPSPTPSPSTEPTSEPTPELSPELTPEPSPEITPEPTTNPTPEITPEPTVTPEPEPASLETPLP